MKKDDASVDDVQGLSLPEPKWDVQRILTYPTIMVWNVPKMHAFRLFQNLANGTDNFPIIPQKEN